MLSSPRRPSRTMRILSSAEKCRRVARRMSFTTCSAGAFVGPDFCLIFAPSKGYDEPEILPSSTRPFCLTIPDGKQSKDRSWLCALTSSFRIDKRLFLNADRISVAQDLDRKVLSLPQRISAQIAHSN